MNFAERLKSLPSVAHLSSLDLLDTGGALVASIHNQPGQAGSLAIYYALAKQHGGTITPEAAALGLQWYAEHTADALARSVEDYLSEVIESPPARLEGAGRRAAAG